MMRVRLLCTRYATLNRRATQMQADRVLVEMHQSNLATVGFAEVVKRFLIKSQIHHNEIESNLRLDFTGEEAVQ